MTDDLSLGSIVIDRDGESSDEAIVVNLPPVDAADWDVPRRGSVAEDNPDYPADERIAIAVYRDRLDESYPHYAGIRPIPLAELNERGVPFYAFPRSRLNPVGRTEPPRLPITRLRPSPYHARSFTAGENEAFIERTRQRGEPHAPVLVRPIQTGTVKQYYEVLNGHKRVWASHAAGLERVPCCVAHVDDWQAAQTFAKKHLSDYDGPAFRRAVAALRERWGERANELITVPETRGGRVVAAGGGTA